MSIKNTPFAVKLLGCASIPLLTLLVVMSLNSKAAPSFEAVSGKTYSWTSDKWTLVNYFAEWCKPCLEELPELNELSHANELRVFGISYDSLSDTDMKGLIDRYQIQFPVLKSASVEALPLSLPAVLPTTYLLSPDGEVVDVLHGKVTIGGIENLLNKHQGKK